MIDFSRVCGVDPAYLCMVLVCAYSCAFIIERSCILFQMGAAEERNWHVGLFGCQMVGRPRIAYLLYFTVISYIEL